MSSQRYRCWSLNRLLALTLLLGLVAAAYAAAPVFSVDSVRPYKEGGVHLVDAELSLGFSHEMRKALHNGVPLEFKLEVEVFRLRRWLPDEDVADLSQRFLLVYQSLTRQYLVRHQNTEVQRSFSELEDALDFISHIHALPVLDVDLLNPRKTYLARMRFRINLGSLPLPLQVRAYTKNGWRAESGWKAWQLQ